MKLGTSYLVLPLEVPQELDAIHKRRGENSDLAQQALKFIDSHERSFVRAPRSFAQGPGANDARIMQCGMFFATIGGQARTKLVTADVALRVSSAGNGVALRHLSSEVLCDQAPFKRAQHRDPLDVTHFLLAHAKTDPLLTDEEWMTSNDAIAALQLAKLHDVCHRPCLKELRSISDCGSVSLEQVLEYAITKRSSFALSCVSERQEEFVGTTFLRALESILLTLEFEDIVRLIDFFASFKHKEQRGVHQGLIAIARQPHFVKMATAKLWRPLSVLAQAPECKPLIGPKLPQRKASEPADLTALRNLLRK